MLGVKMSHSKQVEEGPGESPVGIFPYEVIQ